MLDRPEPHGIMVILETQADGEQRVCYDDDQPRIDHVAWGPAWMMREFVTQGTTYTILDWLPHLGADSDFPDDIEPHLRRWRKHLGLEG